MRRRRRTPARVIAGMLVAAAIVVGMTACDGGDDSSGKASAPTAPPAEKPLPEGVNTEALAAFLPEMAAGRNAPYRATYAYTGGPDAPIPSGTLRLAQDATRVRSELVGGAEDPAVAFVGGSGGTIACASRQGPSSWQCFETAARPENALPAIDAGDLYDLADRYRPAQYYFSFTPTTDSIAGVDARCLDIAGTADLPDKERKRVGDRARFCVAANGAPLLVDVPGGDVPISLRATEFSDAVSDADFTPPAQVQPGPPNVEFPTAPEDPS